MRVFCLFEQSGTFKNAFIKYGISAEDYDILNDFGETDHVIDLFTEIRGGYRGAPSLFDEITPDDLIMAFFPCTRFEARVPMNSRGEAAQMANWDMIKKLKYTMQTHAEINELYQLICELALIGYNRGLKMIIENPYTAPHYLTMYWPLKPAIIDKDRTQRGDHYRKPTQYFFINCEPKHNFLWNEQIERETYIISKPQGLIEASGVNRQKARSLIAPEYAERFIKEFIL